MTVIVSANQIKWRLKAIEEAEVRVRKRFRAVYGDKGEAVMSAMIERLQDNFESDSIP